MRLDDKRHPENSWIWGEIGVTKTKDWERLTPYSPAIRIQGIKFQNETPLIAFVNDPEEPEKPPDFW